MNYQKLFGTIASKRSFLCIGLDTEVDKLPPSLMKYEDPVFEFNRRIIDSTADYAVAYKPNIAFYECNGISGWKSLEATLKYIKNNYPDILVIADAKRGDIGNTSRMYARAFFEELDFDAITVAPYMGGDSVKPFLEYSGKWVVILALTSNKGADDFQYHNDNGIRLFERVLDVSKKWGSPDNTMYVVGATRAEMLMEIRRIVPDHFLLVPGVGAQGIRFLLRPIVDDNSVDFDKTAGRKAKEMQQEMAGYLAAGGII
jgi:orotidine-5'-phosphate decarboxylase